MDINHEEQDILTGLETEEWQSVANRVEEINRYRTLAANQLGNSVEIALSTEDYTRLTDLAQSFGKSTEGLSQEVLVKFLNGELVEKTV